RQLRFYEYTHRPEQHRGAGQTPGILGQNISRVLSIYKDKGVAWTAWPRGPPGGHHLAPKKCTPDGRRVHHWRGRDRKQDTSELADAIVAAVDLFNRDGTLVRLDGNGKLVSVNLADLVRVCRRTEAVTGRKRAGRERA